MLVGIIIATLGIVSIISIIAFFLALSVEANVGWNYPFAFHVAIWSAMFFAISMGGMLLLIH